MVSVRDHHLLALVTQPVLCLTTAVPMYHHHVNLVLSLDTCWSFNLHYIIVQFNLAAIDVLEFVNVTTNLTVVLGRPSQATSQFHCSVRASRIANFEWTFKTSSHTSNLQPTPRQITNEVGALDARYSVVSTDYSSVLTIGSVEFSDAGNYTCIASIGDRISPIMATAIHIVHGIEKPYLAYSVTFCFTMGFTLIL